jgi:predicted ATPase/class 3 adenylate cyclase
VGRASLPTGLVTLVFTDIEGSTRLLQEFGEGYGQLLADHHRLLREVWAAHGGVEVGTEGDAFFVAFASARSAVDAARLAQRALAGDAWSDGRLVRVRIGVHSGEPQVRDGAYWGIDVHYAARLCSAANGGQVLLSAATRALVADADVDDLGEHALKDFPASRNVFHRVVDGQRANVFPPPRTLSTARTNLPSLATPLVGRELELADLARRLTESDERLVTLTGSGGSGKTKLAIACGSELLDRFADGVFLVALAPVPDVAGVVPALADTIDAGGRARGDEARLLEHLRGREMLLVIDNFEHVVGAAPTIGRLIELAPRVRALVTSQAPLRVAAESVVPVEPLVVPVAAETDPERLASVPSVALFVERARAADPSFALASDNAAAVAALCRALDGLPLALELAAARVRMAGVQGVFDALGRGIDALGRGSRDMPDRQRGLRAALDYTVSLLEDEPRELFADLGAFADAWTIEDAERLCGAELDLWEAMATLLDFSLIRTRGDGRLTMAERVKTHARELLARSGREVELRARHAELMAQKTEAIDLTVMVDHSGSIARIREILDELEYAISWSRANDPDLYRRLLASCARPLYLIGRLGPLIPDIKRLSDQEDGSDVISGRMLLARGIVERSSGETAASVGWVRRAVECHRQTADRTRLLSTMALHIVALTHADDGPGARIAIAEALELAAGHPDHRFGHLFEGLLAFAAVAEGQFDEAEERLQEILRHPERNDFASLAASAVLADCAFGRGDGAVALERYLVALEDDVAAGDVVNSLLQLAGVAASLSLLRRDAEAARLTTATDRIGRELGQRLYKITPVLAELDELERRVGPQEWTRHRAATADLTFDGLVAEAQELSAAEVSRDGGDPGVHPSRHPTA